MNIITNRSFVAGGDIYVGRVVVGTAGSEGVVTQAANATAFPQGIASMQQKGPPGVDGTTANLAAASGDYLQIHGPGEECTALAGGTIQAFGLCSANSDGEVVAYTATAGGSWIVGQAMEDAADGDYIRFKVWPLPIAENVV